MSSASTLAEIAVVKYAVPPAIIGCVSACAVPFGLSSAVQIVRRFAACEASNTPGFSESPRIPARYCVQSPPPGVVPPDPPSENPPPSLPPSAPPSGMPPSENPLPSLPPSAPPSGMPPSPPGGLMLPPPPPPPLHAQRTATESVRIAIRTWTPVRQSSEGGGAGQRRAVAWSVSSAEELPQFVGTCDR